MPEAQLNVHEHDVEQDEWYEALPPHQGGAMHWIHLATQAAGLAANLMSVGVLSCGLIGRWRKRRAMKGMTDAERLAAAHPLYQTMRDIQVSAQQIQADVKALLARADAIAAEQRAQRSDAQVK